MRSNRPQSIYDLIQQAEANHDGVRIVKSNTSSQSKFCGVMYKSTPVVDITYNPANYNASTAQTLLATLKREIPGVQIKLRQGNPDEFNPNKSFSHNF